MSGPIHSSAECLLADEVVLVMTVDEHAKHTATEDTDIFAQI